MVTTDVIEVTGVVKLDAGDERSHTRRVADNVGKLLARIDEVMASKKFESERDWCARAGVSPNYIGALRSKHGTGEAKTAKMDQVAKLAHSASVSVDWLMGSDAKYEIPPTPVFKVAEPTSLEPALETFAWPEDLEPEIAVKVITLVRQEALRAGTPMPQSYWHSRIRRAIADKQRRPRD